MRLGREIFRCNPMNNICLLYTSAFRQVDNGARINYTLHKHLDGSVYIKTKSDDNHNERRNYVLNFYDKADRLKYLSDRKYKIPTRDFEFAQDNLRLEVQCGFLFIKRLCKKYRIQPLFGNLLDYEIAYYACLLYTSRCV